MAGSLLAVAMALAAPEPLAVFAQSSAVDSRELIDRVSGYVQTYYARAQSVICLETVRMQSLGMDLLNDTSPSRRLDYELRLAWDPAPGADVAGYRILYGTQSGQYSAAIDVARSIDAVGLAGVKVALASATLLAMPTTSALSLRRLRSGTVHLV